MKLLPLDLAGMLAFGNYVPANVEDDAEAMCRIAYLCDLINSHVERQEFSVSESVPHEFECVAELPEPVIDMRADGDMLVLTLESGRVLVLAQGDFLFKDGPVPPATN